MYAIFTRYIEIRKTRYIICLPRGHGHYSLDYRGKRCIVSILMRVIKRAVSRSMVVGHVLVDITINDVYTRRVYRG